ncbi:hypothetical protein [Sulfurospirillum arcachonense]|uniref:hypothetical protein n=1 Tax=Sulfurospirillum arcachonense TaxID=57666 RepID=UPI000468EE1E|nr:hypothetical protein [Sulfurospirillum arcachonense]
MKYIKYLIPLIILLLLSGCGTKRQNFEPKSISGEIDYDGALPAKIVDVVRSGATLENGQIITKDGLLDIKIPENYTFIGDSKGRYLATSKCGNLVVLDKNSHVIYEKKFDSVVATATIKEDLLAVILGNNTQLLIDITSKKELYKNNGDKVYAHDSKIAAPYFLTSLIIFPTLDGKLLIIDLKTNKLLRDVVVKSEKFFSNIIYLDVLGDRLVAATKQRVVSINPKSMAFLDEEVKDVIILKNRVLVFTKDGRIILTDADLKVLKTKKFKFASFVGTIHGEFIYIVERGGFLIATDLNLISSNIYELPDEIESYVYTTNDKFYYKNSYFKLSAPRKK